jgi:3-oxoacyl-[acyl-carrier protein] reductase
VAIGYPSPEKFPPDLAALGPDAVAIQCDVTSVDQIRSSFGELHESFGGRLDILVNNAGVFPRAHVLYLDEATWDTVLDVNLKGTFFCSQEAGRMMKAQGNGCIVNIASEGAFRPYPRSAHYSASKAGIIALTKGFASSLARHGVRVNAIAPGLVDTAQPRDGMTEEEIEESAHSVPLGRIGQPLDVARVALFLASELSEWMTGQTISVNGGTTMVP